MRRPATLFARKSASSSASPSPTPRRMTRPLSIAPTVSPSTVTAPLLTRCTSARTRFLAPSCSIWSAAPGDLGDGHRGDALFTADEADPLVGGGLDADRVDREAQRRADGRAHGGGVRGQLRALGDD